MDPEVSSNSWLIFGPLDTECNRFSSYWPMLKQLDIPTPTTKLIPLEGENAKTAAWDTNQIATTIKDWGASQAFIRSDYKAAPRRLNDGSCINNLDHEEINRTIRSLLTQLSASGWEYGDVLVLREWLDLDFCMRQSHPNCHPEVRVFIEAGEILGVTPIRVGSKSVCDHQYQHLESLLEQANTDTPRDYAHTVAESFTKKTWAVDFVMDTSGDWYCTEMGLNAVRWVEKQNRWINHCDHDEIEPFGPSDIHSAALPISMK